MSINLAMFSHLVLVLISVLFSWDVNAVPVDNGVEGDPEIECGPTSVIVSFNTNNPFEGHVYVKGLYDNPECRNDEGGRQVAGIELPFDSCNVARTRSLNPRGIFVTTTVVISFHPLFVTKVDRAYRVQCFYMEADKTVSTGVQVSDMTTSFITQNVPMPICRYEILDSSPDGEPLDYAVVGQHVYHKWTCDTEAIDTFCAVVHSCFVDDGEGETVQLLNEEGCALDKYLLNNLEYPTDLTAGQESHVYKYADRLQLYYQCQVRITIKEPGQACARPVCDQPRGFGAIGVRRGVNSSSPNSMRRLRRKRSNADADDVFDDDRDYNTMDVRTSFSALEILDPKLTNFQLQTVPSGLPRTGHHQSERLLIVSTNSASSICVSPHGYTLTLMVTGFALTALIISIAIRRVISK